MEGQRLHGVVLDEISGSEVTKPEVDPKWIKLVEKLAKHPKNRNLILLPEEVVMIVTKFRDLTRQLLGTMGFIDKYAPLMKQISEVAGNVRASQADQPSDARSESDQPVTGGSHGVDHANLQDSSQTE